MSSSAITTQVAQLKIGSVQNQADSSSVYSAGVWSFKNSTALTSVTITDAGNVGVGISSPSSYGHGGTNKFIQVENSSTTVNAQAHYIINSGWGSAGASSLGTISWALPNVSAADKLCAFVGALTENAHTSAVPKVALTFATNAGTGPGERMRIDASGNLLVGMTVANETTQNGFLAGGGVKGYVAASMAGSTNGQGNSYHLYSTGAGAYRFYVGLGGTIFATSTSISAISDISLKENVRDLETGLSQVLALKPRRFDWKEETQIEQKNVAGFIAQEVEEVLPELVYEYKYNETETKKSLKMGDMLPTLVKAIQEQQAQIEALKAEVAALKAP